MSELHRISAGGGTPQADVIFIHGLDGHAFKTWQHDPDRQTDCWLHWLGEDAAAVAVHTLDYAARSSQWLGQAMPLVDRAKEVLNELARRGIGVRPVVFVCHSLGGLLAKQLLRTASDDAAPTAWRRIADQTRGVAFVATPHAGADLARTLRRVGWALRTSPAIDDLRAHAPALRDLNEWYGGYAICRAIRTLCYYETYKTAAARYGWIPLPIKVVEESDADPGLGVVVRPMPLDADHISIAKPPKRYHQLCDAILTLVHEIAPPVPPDDKPMPIGPLRIRADLGDFQASGAKQDKVLAALRGGGQGGIGKTALVDEIAIDRPAPHNESDPKNDLILFAFDHVFPTASRYIDLITNLAEGDNDYTSSIIQRHIATLKNDHLQGTALYVTLHNNAKRDRATQDEIEEMLGYCRCSMGKLHDKLDNIIRSRRRSGRWLASYDQEIRKLEHMNDVLTSEFRKLTRRPSYRRLYNLSPEVQFHSWPVSLTEEVVRRVRKEHKLKPIGG